MTPIPISARTVLWRSAALSAVLAEILACSSTPARAPNGSTGGSAGTAAVAGTGGTSAVEAGVGGGDSGVTQPLGPPPDFGPNVLIFDPSMSSSEIQAKLDQTIGAQVSSQFGSGRFAYFFKPGAYSLDVKIGYYMQALGLGKSPSDVTITGAVRSKADWFGGNATLNFWRGVENMTVVPTQDAGVNIWAVAQGTSFRRMHVKGPMHLSDGGWSSGGFIADSQFDGTVDSGSQQQFFSRNTGFSKWQGGSWNMVFVGVTGAPSGAWPASPYTVVDTTPVLREKPYLWIDADGHYFVQVPALESNSSNVSWSATASSGTAVTTDRFYVARPDTDSATTINAALASGKHLLLTPGVYHLDKSIEVTRANTIVFGLGLATLVADAGNAALTISDVDGVVVSGLIVQAGSQLSPTLVQVGPSGSSADHSANPTALYDLYCRVGGAAAGTATSCLTIESSDVIGDNLWLWRADHGTGAGWTQNVSDTGVIVDGARVTIYGLFVEHFQQFETLWNGNGGRLYFYQSEMPYDPPSQTEWQHAGVNGYASYKVAASVTTHAAWGLGVYCVFNNAVKAENAVETPTGTGIKLQHLMTQWIGRVAGSEITHIVNGTGNAVNQGSTQARTSY